MMLVSSQKALLPLECVLNRDRASRRGVSVCFHLLASRIPSGRMQQPPSIPGLMKCSEADDWLDNILS
eukprot:scaffold102481_cov43-Prasinocladus_malaysianus.AAC.2